ncbi:MAG: hypothetical protein SFV22_16360 [Saprospiraceae bacterium]|nr:hypothetical protein [Saprospiraceae bacterium]
MARIAPGPFGSPGGYSQQLSVKFVLNDRDRFTYQFGLGYANFQSKREFETYYQGRVLRHDTHEDLIVPLLLRYSFGKSVKSWMFTGGIVPAFKLHRKATKTLLDPIFGPSTILDITNEREYPVFDLFATFGFGYRHQMKSGHAIYLQPIFGTNFPKQLINIYSNIAGNDYVDGQPGVFWFGIETGISFDVVLSSRNK